LPASRRIPALAEAEQQRKRETQYKAATWAEF